jgi:membrane protease YdiL (CAAX protease family)
MMPCETYPLGGSPHTWKKWAEGNGHVERCQSVVFLPVFVPHPRLKWMVTRSEPQQPSGELQSARSHAFAALCEGPWVNYLRTTREPACVTLSLLPLLLIYGLGVLLASPRARSGLDIVSGSLLSLLGTDGYVGSVLSLAVILLAAVTWKLRTNTLPTTILIGPIMLESAIYAFMMGGLIIHVMQERYLMGGGIGEFDSLEQIVISVGAGLHEEVVFRLLLLPALSLALERGISIPRPIAWAIGAVLSSLAFAAAHHLNGEAFVAHVFAYRTLAGFVFASLFIARGLGVAVWTHTMYDLQVYMGS